MRGRARKWILLNIGQKDIRAVTREDIESIVRRLDRAILSWEKHDGERGEGRLSPSTAANVWGDLVHAFDEAVRAKDPKLRVLTVSPCANVRGPERGDDRAGPILYSDELVALLVGKAVEDGTPNVPLYRRRAYAMAHYTMARRSELAALTVADVDLAHATITISKQVDRNNKKETKKTKTRRTRTIDIEPNLYPLVERLMIEAGKATTARLLRVPPTEDSAELLRKDLWTVGARDDRLHTEDATRTM
jgi:integrase